MSEVRDHIRKELAGKLQRYGVVIWDDREASYATVVDDVSPADTTIARFDRSWFELRREIESHLAGETPPSLLVYVTAPAPDPDPLEELRAIGSGYRSLLPTVLRSALQGRLTDRRIDELGKQCSTLLEVEAALDAGASETDARLMALVGAVHRGRYRRRATDR